MLRKSPGFTAIAIITLALGIGASTLLFSLLASVYLRPLPVRQPQQLVRLVQHVPRLGTVSEFPYVYYQALRDRARSFASVFGETYYEANLAMTDPKPAEAITLRTVTGNFFRALGVHALYGRALRPSDAHYGSGTPPAVLSYGFWKERFAGNADVVHGQKIVINRRYFAVVGVMPPGFGGLSLDTAPDVWIPLRTSRSMAEVQLELAGRLKAGANSATAEAECRTIWAPVMTNFYRHVRKLPASSVSELVRNPVLLEPLEHGVSVVRSQFGKIFVLLLVSAGVLFLILCSNIAGLFLAKGSARRQEIAVRSALGATRARLVRQMLAEGLLLAAVGAAGGLLMARAAAPLVTQALPPIHNLAGWVVPVSNNVRINASAYLFSLALAVFAALLFGLIPALAASRRSLDPILRASRSSVAMSGRQVLIISQIALCVVLLVSAGLFVRTFWNLKEVNPGFDASRVDVFKDVPNGQAVPHPLMTTLMDRVRELPGVASVASASIGVMQAHGISATVAAAGQQITRADFLDANLNYISPGYFDTLGMRILGGRNFLPSDIPHGKSSGAAKAIVNQALAERFFPSTAAVGKFIGLGVEGSVAKPEYQIIGVVGDSKYRSLRAPFRPTLYLPQINTRSFVLYVRTKMPPRALILPIRKTLASVDPALPLGEADTLSQETGTTIATERVTALLATLFGIAAALLVCLGIYGLLAYHVAQRRREIGIRVALGAQSEEVLKLVVSQGLRLAVVGTTIGIVCALGVALLVSSMLYGVKAIDPVTFAAVPLVVTVMSLSACWIPARRAARLDPMTVLRQE